MIQEILATPNIEAGEENAIDIALTCVYMMPIIHYLQLGDLSQDDLEAKKICKRATKYILMSRKFYKMGRASLMLRCLGGNEIALVLAVVYQGDWGKHIGGRVFAHKLLRVGGYYCINERHHGFHEEI